MQVLTNLSEIERFLATASDVSLVCQGTDHAEVCAVCASDAARLLGWVRNGNPSIDPEIRRNVLVLDHHRPPQLVAYIVGDSRVTLSVVGATFDSQAELDT